MKQVLLFLSLIGFIYSTEAAAATFPFTFYVHDTTGVVADTPLPANYQFAAAAVGGYTNVVLKATNSSTSTVFLGTVFAGITNGTTQLNPNFSVTGLFQNLVMAPGGSVIFTVNFSPTTVGNTIAYLQASYQVQQGSCSFTSTNVTTQCPSGLGLVTTVNATGTQPQLVLSYTGSSGSSVTLQPSATTPVNFGNVSLSASSSITFTLSNQSAIALPTPAISVPAQTTFVSNPFLLDTSKVPASLAPGASAPFVITFAPGQTGVVTTSLIAGSNSYLLQGAGIVIADIDALHINYVDTTGVEGFPQAASPISFGQIVAGTGTSAALTFTVTNDQNSYNAVSVPSLSVTGANFKLSNLTGTTAFPTSLAPGQSIGFTITFSPANSGNYTGSLAVGSRIFSLSGLSVSSPLPSLSLQVTPLPLTSSLQGSVSVQLAAPALLDVTGQASITFTPSITNVTDDPAIMFMATSSRQISLSVAAGQQVATYNKTSDSQISALAFQTGTTAGTLTFTLTFPNTPTYTQSFTITPTTPQIISATAIRSTPNLIVTVTGYDNTYSAGNLGFTFYDNSGNTITPVQVNATSQFQQLFFNNNTGGGTFQFSATFPVTGDVTKVGSVGITVSNSAGQTTNRQSFQ